MVVLRQSGKRMLFNPKIPAPQELSPYRKKDGSYSFPVCGDIYRRLRYAFPNLVLEDDLAQTFKEVAAWQEEGRRLSRADDLDLPYTNLFPYQRVAVGWLSHTRKGILADEQGLGKTVMSLVAAREANPRKALIICSSAKRRDWLEHVQEWVPGAQCQILEGEDEDRKLSIQDWQGYLVVNYRKVELHGARREFKGVDLIIVDEAHKMRNRKTLLFKVLKRMARSIRDLYLLTASPTVNSAGDMWTLLHLCDPVRFSSYWGFVFRFCEVTDDGYGLKVGTTRDDEGDNLERLLSTYVLYREGMLDLPEPQISVMPYYMDGLQDDLYREMDKEKEASWGGQTVDALNDISLITRLRQLALHPGLIFRDYNGPSKLDVLEDLIRGREGKVVIFSHYATLAHMTAIELCERGIDSVYYTGELSEKDRQSHLDEFQKGDAQVISITHGTGGEGLNLIEADRAIFLETAWHPAGNKHALRRILRHGQVSQDVEVVFIVTQDSVEEHMWNIVREKRPITIEELMRRRER